MSAPTGSAPLLPQRGHGSGEADRDHAIEQADVDPELERVRRGDAQQLAFEQPPLDLAPLLGRVARAIGRERGVVAQAIGSETVDQLRGAAALGEAERAQAARDQVGHQLRGLAERAGAQAELLVGERWVPERHGALGSRRGVAADHRCLGPDQACAQLTGVGDRRRGEQELRFRSVDPGKPPQPPQDVRHVRAEDAAIDMCLVHDHVGEVREHVSPAVMVRQHAHVKHVRVRQDQVGPLAHLPAALRGRIAVVDRRAELWQPEGRERPQLILGQRLRRVEVERPLLRLPRERIQHGQVERKGLAARRARGDDQVLASLRRLPGRRLVGVERVDPLCSQSLSHAWVQFLRQGCEQRVARIFGAQVGELLADEQIVPPGNARGHEPMVALPSRGARMG